MFVVTRGRCSHVAGWCTNTTPLGPLRSSCVALAMNRPRPPQPPHGTHTRAWVGVCPSPRRTEPGPNPTRPRVPTRRRPAGRAAEAGAALSPTPHPPLGAPPPRAQSAMAHSIIDGPCAAESLARCGRGGGGVGRPRGRSSPLPADHPPEFRRRPRVPHRRYAAAGVPARPPPPCAVTPVLPASYPLLAAAGGGDGGRHGARRSGFS